jgi:hypothetical protein
VAGRSGGGRAVAGRAGGGRAGGGRAGGRRAGGRWPGGMECGPAAEARASSRSSGMSLYCRFTVALRKPQFPLYTESTIRHNGVSPKTAFGVMPLLRSSCRVCDVVSGERRGAVLAGVDFERAFQHNFEWCSPLSPSAAKAINGFNGTHPKFFRYAALIPQSSSPSKSSSSTSPSIVFFSVPFGGRITITCPPPSSAAPASSSMRCSTMF